MFLLIVGAGSRLMVCFTKLKELQVVVFPVEVVGNGFQAGLEAWKERMILWSALRLFSSRTAVSNSASSK